MSTTEVQSINKLLQTVTSSYTDDSPAYCLCDVVNLTVFPRRVFWFSSIGPRDGCRKTLPTRKRLADRERRNLEIDGLVWVVLPEICVGVRVFADASCSPSDDEILILWIWSGDTVLFISGDDAWRPIFNIDDSIAEIDGHSGIPVTNLIKFAIARKQNFAGVEKRNKTGRTWQVPIEWIRYTSASLECQTCHHRLAGEPKSVWDGALRCRLTMSISLWIHPWEEI